MTAGHQTEATIVRWFPGEATGVQGDGQTSGTIPTDEDAAEATARAAVDTRVSTLSTRLVASGVIPTGV